MTKTQVSKQVDVRVLPLYAAGEVEVPWSLKNHVEELSCDTSWPDHSHPTHELLWNERGASTITVGHRTWTISPVMGLWIPAGMVHSGEAPAGTLCRTTQFDIATVPALGTAPVAVEMTDLLTLLMRRLDDPRLAEKSLAITEAMIADVLAPAAHAMVIHVPVAQLLQPIVSATMDRPGDVAGLEFWARELGVSARTISRAFIAETGLGFSQWVTSVRVLQAAQLLARGRSIHEAMSDVGYTSASAFGAAFKRVTGLRPSEFRVNGGSMSDSQD